MPELNGVMMQYFHWYIPDTGIFWDQVKAQASQIAQAGFTALWLPPAYKGLAGKNDVGYGVYDLYDLGEFDQKGSVRTKYGTRDQYLQAIQAVQAQGVQIYADAVLNHRMGGDHPEVMKATPFPQENRLTPKGGLQEIKSYTYFQFPGRNHTYSDFEMHWQHFDAVDYNDYNPNDRGTVYLLEGKQFDDYVALEKGNFSYLMGCDLDFQSPEIQREMIQWGKWYLETTHVDGFRLDAIKHISAWFFPIWLDALEKHVGKDLFVVGEYWAPELSSLQWYLSKVGDRMTVFDVPLHYNFHYASKAGRSYDLRKLLDGTLVRAQPGAAVTFVENHDSQPLQALESVVEPWFKPLAYAFILLRRDGYPCVFYADYYGAEYEDWGRDGQRYPIVIPAFKSWIDQFLFARHHYGHGEEYDYFDHPNVIGWTRLGNAEHPQAMAVLISNGFEGYKWMEVGMPNQVFRDLTGQMQMTITSNAQGWAEFRCLGGSVSVWVPV